MRKFLLAFINLNLIFAAYTFRPQPAAAEKTSAPEIRFGLIGTPRDVNVWELFDKTGASYLDYSLRSEYWAHLYYLAPPEFSFKPFAAQGTPTDIVQDGDFYFSIVKLRSDLKWTDGSPFTAADVAFTVNTALNFELGFDWNARYSREYLDHAEALNSDNVKFFFKKKPNVGVWQYGALQGPIVQKKFWEAKAAESAKFLPQNLLKSEIEKARATLATVQWDVKDLTQKLSEAKSAGQGIRPLEIDLEHRQREAQFAQNNLDGLLEQYETNVRVARQMLYAAEDKGEPTLGTWIFESKKNNIWVNKSNPDFPFGKPNFERAVYYFFNNENDALAAFKNKQIDFILSPNGISSVVKGAKTIPTYSTRFLVFNPLKTQFSDPIFHVALNCMVDRKILAFDILQGKSATLDAFVLSPQWHDSGAKDICLGMSKTERIEYAVKILKDAGYSWGRQPTKKLAGQKMTSPNGDAFLNIILSVPFKETDAQRYNAAKYIVEQAQYLGIRFSLKEMGVNDVVYAVYSSQKYDAAIVGWRLSEYPGYMCEWFGGENPYLFSGNQFASVCGALNAEPNLEASRKSMRQVESRLMTELPFIPLYMATQTELYQNISYPASNILGGWSGLYGAPSYAMPSP